LIIVLKLYKKKFKLKKIYFKHGKTYLLPDNIFNSCYHPSPRNVNTKVITSSMINQLFQKAKKIAKF
jgi:uracil-DNA glycosylase